MLYSGDVEKINKDNEGNIIIATPAGNITDHAPKSFYKESKETIKSSLELKQNIVSFQLITHNSSLITIIDPWTTTPDSLTTNNCALDVKSDNFGNVYVSGGVYPYKLSKYSANGNLLWTFTYPTGWGFFSATLYEYSKFCIFSNSGTIFIGEGFNSIGPRVMKINSNGNLINTSLNFPVNNEIWVMIYNYCSGQLMGFGGGTNSLNNLKLISDTNLNSNTTSTAINFNGASTAYNDISSVVMDNNGDFYAYLSLNNINDHLLKSLYSSNYNAPCAFNVNPKYTFDECYNYGIQGLGSRSARANILANNISYLYSYDGQILKAWNKTTGAMLDSVIINAGYSNGVFRNHEGIAVDECNNIWVGGHDTVHVYSFNGTSFTAGTPITISIVDEVYDIHLNSTYNILSICGNGFLTTVNVAPCNIGFIVTNTTNTCSNGLASVSVSGGTLPYNYIWSNGATTSSITASPGTYYLTVTDNSCVQHTAIDTIIISQDTSSVQADSLFCTQSDINSGDTINLNLTGGSLGTSANWYWYSGSCGGNIIGTGTSTTQYPTEATTYYVRAEGFCNTTSCISLTISVITNIIIESINKNDIIIYPNPVNSSITINIKENNSIINIYNLKGQLMKENNLKKGDNIIDVKELAKGEYLIEIKTEKNKYNYKIIKE